MLSVWNAVSWLKDALASRELVDHLTRYYWRDDRLFASDGRITASIPCDIASAVTAHGPALIPGKEFERLLKAMRPDRSVTVLRDDTGIQFSQGRFKARVPTVDPETWPYAEQDGVVFFDLPEAFVDGLRRLRPFVSDNATQAWATCIQIEADGLLATNNIVIARAVCSLPSVLAPCLLPTWGIDFLLSHVEGLAKGGLTDDMAHFEWSNGGRMRTQLITGAFPARAKSMCQPPVEAGSAVELAAEWREAYERVALVANGGPIVCHADRLEAGRNDDVLHCEDGAETPTPPSGLSRWSERHLTPVLAQADWWVPQSWPNPAAWGRTDGTLVGIIASLRES